ncbi:monovalent cation/H(+) antiporter subunit G [soil metagenome]
MIDALIIMFVVLGAFFMAVGSLGILRLKEFFHRIHPAAKSSTIGLFFLLVGLTLAVPEEDVITKAILAVVFIAATAPVGAHLLCRAAYRHGVHLHEDSLKPVIDEYGPAVAAGKDGPQDRMRPEVSRAIED